MKFSKLALKGVVHLLGLASVSVIAADTTKNGRGLQEATAEVTQTEADVTQIVHNILNEMATNAIASDDYKVPDLEEFDLWEFQEFLDDLVARVNLNTEEIHENKKAIKKNQIKIAFNKDNIKHIDKFLSSYKGIHNICYSPKLAYWDTHYEVAAKLGGHLISIHDDATSKAIYTFVEFVTDKYPPLPYFIGGIKVRDGDWKWHGDDYYFWWDNDYVPGVYSNWAANQPDLNGGCLAVRGDNYKWDDRSCKDAQAAAVYALPYDADLLDYPYLVCLW